MSLQKEEARGTRGKKATMGVQPPIPDGAETPLRGLRREVDGLLSPEPDGLGHPLWRGTEGQPFGLQDERPDLER